MISGFPLWVSVGLECIDDSSNTFFFFVFVVEGTYETKVKSSVYRKALDPKARSDNDLISTGISFLFARIVPTSVIPQLRRSFASLIDVNQLSVVTFLLEL